ncbi:hypothetical protein AKJ48_01295 [candidate division MSBL1 archaeon SCGC-AAA261O19]|uniref:HTH arsR-type domain-containing protein n=3 Tax=candidate division MSBL1 TaxID=215777 RepID=A0A133V212_9EURY|nr:hypothetical protein AKJ42_00475 [candidate division MSBL1 archaeon SCGC-AAA261C02]KXB04827.1 hypothetical protein AKJ48_01295 [candidate division MSBL1 archaeon SCGC-AAA261O19]KXB09329.1 hypothetical protein AKJ46_00570 [candidate division MSBL1 archaeon SCGC-AAA833K04]
MTEDQLRLLKCVANETRLQILKLLAKEERCVCEIMGELDKEQSLISHHLKSLRECGLITKRRRGKKILYKISDPSLVKFTSKAEELGKKFCQT